MPERAQCHIGRRLRLPEPVAQIYEAASELEERFRRHSRRFTPDGHLVGSIGEVLVAETFGLELYPNSQRGHDAHGPMGDVQIKVVGLTGRRVAFYDDCDYLIVLKFLSPKEAEIIYCGSGNPVAESMRNTRRQRNGQRTISVKRLQQIAAQQTPTGTAETAALAHHR